MTVGVAENLRPGSGRCVSETRGYHGNNLAWGIEFRSKE